MNPHFFQNKTYVVTGATSGIGESIAKTLAELGATVIISSRNLEKLKLTHSELSFNNNQNHLIIPLDLSNFSTFSEYINELPNIDGIIHAAGILQKRPVNNLTENNIDLIFKTNFTGPTLLTSQILKNKKIKNDSSIIFITSIATEVASLGNSVYMASKSALKSMAKGMALELAPKRIRVNCIEPALIETNLTQRALSQEQLDNYKLKFPLQRFGKPQEISNAVIFLLSDASSWTTGISLRIDGGITLI